MALIYKVFLNGLNLNGNVYSLNTNYWMFDKTKISLIYSFLAYLCIICFCLANRRCPVCWLSCAGVHRSFPTGCASFWDRRLLGSLLWADEDVDEDLPTSPTTPAPCSLGSASPSQVGHLWEYSLFAYCTFKAINL